MSIKPSPKASAFASSPRTEITYEIETPEGIEQRELPFVIAVMSDLSASRDPAALKLKDRRFNDVTHDDFDQFLHAIAPRLRYKVENVLTDDPDGGKIAVELQFQALKDFDPDQVALQVRPLRELIDLRTSLANLGRSLMGNHKLRELLQELSSNTDARQKIAQSPPVTRPVPPSARTREPEMQQVERRQVEYVQRTEGGTGTSYIKVQQYTSDQQPSVPAAHAPAVETVAAAPDAIAPEEVDLMDRILDESRMGRTPEERTRGREWIQTFVDELNQGSVEPFRDTETMIHSRIAQIDQLLSRQVREIMHAEGFQRLEAAWRGLHYLANITSDMPSVKIKAMDVSKRELHESFHQSVFSQSSSLQSPLFGKVFDETCGTVDGQPFTILLADYEFGRHPDDVDLLIRLSEIAEAANAPVVTNASPQLFDLDSFTQLLGIVDLSKVFDNDAYLKWRFFRKRDQSRFAILTLPHVLMRAPYSGDEDAFFRFEEGVDGSDHSKYLWGGAAWVLAACLAEAFDRDGFTAEVRGLERGGVDGMVLHRYRDETNVRSKPPAEVAIDARAAAVLRGLGVTALRCSVDTGRAGFFDPVTCNAVQYINVDPGDQACSVRVDYILAVCRIAHYVRCIMRDRAGMFDNARQCEDYLNSWIRRYVAPEGGAAGPARPLLEAWFQVYSCGEAGLAVEAFLRPALRGGELQAPLRTCLSATVFGRRLQDMVDEASTRRGRSPGPPAPQLPAGRPEIAAFHPANGTASSSQPELLARLSAANGSARDLFYTNLTLAELLVALEKSDVAAGIVESLLRQAQEFHLDRWESPPLIERLYRVAQLCAPKDVRDSDRTLRGEVVGPPALKPPEG